MTIIASLAMPTSPSQNITPHDPPYDPNHGVTFIVNIEWKGPVNVVTDITVLNNPPVEVDFPSS